MWSDVFYVDATSRTFLRWMHDQFDCLGRATKTRQGMTAGSINGQGRLQVQYKGKMYLCSRVVYELTHGEIEGDMVVDHLDGDFTNNHPSNLVLKSRQHNSQNCSKSKGNTSGKSGVIFQVNSNATYATAYCNDLSGKRISRCFNINTYGLLPAFSKACQARDEMLEHLNRSGAMYTERHGV